jgi:uncharacterized protein YdeI (BOF family)
MQTTRQRIAWTLAAIGVVALASGTALAETNPYTQPDDTWISISGTVQSVTRDAFTLDYGESAVTVEMDDGDRDADAYKLLEGDKVSVYGKIDDDFFEATTIEASRVYVEKLGTYFYASAVDEEEVDSYVYLQTPVVVADTVLQGTVTEVDGDEFTLATGDRVITVEVEDMPYDPLDDRGYQKVRAGDRVSVRGEMDYDLFEGREFVAESIVTLAE